MRGKNEAVVLSELFRSLDFLYTFLSKKKYAAARC